MYILTEKAEQYVYLKNMYLLEFSQEVRADLNAQVLTGLEMLSAKEAFTVSERTDYSVLASLLYLVIQNSEGFQRGQGITKTAYTQWADVTQPTLDKWAKKMCSWCPELKTLKTAVAIDSRSIDLNPDLFELGEDFRSEAFKQEIAERYFSMSGALDEIDLTQMLLKYPANESGYLSFKAEAEAYLVTLKSKHEEDWAEFESDPSLDAWYNWDLRPYLLAKYQLMSIQVSVGDLHSAVEHAKDLLILSHNDALGTRYVIMPTLIELSMYDAYHALVKEYDEDSAFFAYNKALCAISKNQPNAAALLKKALLTNRFIPDYLTGVKRYSESQGAPEYYSPGTVEEAMVYASFAKEAWKEISGALLMLKKVKK